MIFYYYQEALYTPPKSISPNEILLGALHFALLLFTPEAPVFCGLLDEPMKSGAKNSSKHILP